MKMSISQADELDARYLRLSPTSDEEMKTWLFMAIHSGDRPESEATFIRRLKDMGVSPRDIFTCNLARKRKQRSELYNSTATREE